MCQYQCMGPGVAARSPCQKVSSPGTRVSNIVFPEPKEVKSIPLCVSLIKHPHSQAVSGQAAIISL